MYLKHAFPFVQVPPVRHLTRLTGSCWGLSPAATALSSCSRRIGAPRWSSSWPSQRSPTRSPRSPATLHSPAQAAPSQVRPLSLQMPLLAADTCQQAQKGSDGLSIPFLLSLSACASSVNQLAACL